jgi:hypothetical protein
MHNRSHGPSSLPEEAPPPTQCKHTCRSECSPFVRQEILDLGLATVFANPIHQRRRLHNNSCTLHNSSATAAARTATRLAGLRPRSHPSAWHCKLRGSRGAPTLPREQRTRHYHCAGPDKSEKPATPETDEAARQIFWRAHTVHNEDSLARFTRRHSNTQQAHTREYTRARVPREHVGLSITKED